MQTARRDVQASLALDTEWSTSVAGHTHHRHSPRLPLILLSLPAWRIDNLSVCFVWLPSCTDTHTHTDRRGGGEFRLKFGVAGQWM